MESASADDVRARGSPKGLVLAPLQAQAQHYPKGEGWKRSQFGSRKRSQTDRQTDAPTTTTLIASGPPLRGDPYFVCISTTLLRKNVLTCCDTTLAGAYRSERTIFGEFQNCLAKKSLLPSSDEAGQKCVRVGRAHLNSSEIAHPLPDEVCAPGDGVCAVQIPMSARQKATMSCANCLLRNELTTLYPIKGALQLQNLVVEFSMPNWLASRT